MKKNMYSLMLAEDVIREVDRIAAEKRTNRSNLINQVLAEYVALVTPEMHVRNIFDTVEKFVGEIGGGVFSMGAGGMAMSFKSSLRYHYRPTIRYEVEMYRMPDQTIGQFKVAFRTTASDLVVALTRFFKLWMQMESVYIGDFFGGNEIGYFLENGRFTRQFALPNGVNYSESETGEAIGSYIAAFDAMLKGWLDGKYSSAEALEKDYLRYLNGGALII